MKRTVILSKAEIEEAIRKYVQEKAGFPPKSVSIAFVRGDRPFDADTWSATA